MSVCALTKCFGKKNRGEERRVYQIKDVLYRIRRVFREERIRKNKRWRRKRSERVADRKEDCPEVRLQIRYIERV